MFELFRRNRRKLEVFGTKCIFFGAKVVRFAQQAELARPRPPPAYRGVLPYAPRYTAPYLIRVVVQALCCGYLTATVRCVPCLVCR